MRTVIAILLLAFCLGTEVKAQSWQQAYDDLLTMSDDEAQAEELADSYELLEQLAAHPLDLNCCTREDLEQLPFLSMQQVMDIQEYLYRYGPMRSLGELRMVRSLDLRQLTLLPFFVSVSGEADEPHEESFPRLDTLLHRAKHSLSATLRVPFYERKGDKNGYLGYPYRHTLRYELNSGNYLRLGVVGAQDAGEPFMDKGNNWGYDTYSYYVQLRKLGRLENLVAGKYKLSAGMGLVLGQSFQLGKLATLQSLGRTVQTIRPHSSRSESDYFQGAAATVSLWKPVALSAFVSWRPIDATLTKTGEAQTLLTDGYHRTPTEMAKKHNTHLAATGMHLAYRAGGLQLGATAITTQLDRELKPQRQTLYSRHYAHGTHFFNISADYAFIHHRLVASGETAVDGHGALATINTLSVQPTARLGLMALQRFYSYRFTTLYGHAFSDGSHTQNESGIYLGATWNPLAHLQLQGYADYAYFPWARYQVSLSSHSWDFLTQATWQQGHWTLQARHRSHLRQKDNDEKNALIANNLHRERFSVTWQQQCWQLKTQIDLAHTFYKQAEHGWMVSQHATFSPPSPNLFQLTLMAAYFNTDSYQSRVYVYEQQLQHEFYFPTYYGEGLRLNMQARINPNRRLRLAFRMGYTNYFDRSVISSGLQQINHSHQTDADFQLQWRL